MTTRGPSGHRFHGTMYTLIILFFLISIVASFLCSVLEAVLLSITPAYAERLSREDPEIAAVLNDFQHNIDKPLAAILTLNTIAHTVGAIGVGNQAARIWGESIMSSLVIPVVMTLAILILSEIIPKTLGANYWQELTRFTVRTLKIIMFALAPLVTVSQVITRSLKKDKNKSVLSRADFTAMAELGARQGVLDQRESSLLQNFMRFGSVRAEDVMTPRPVVIAASEDVTLADFHNKHPRLQFSRIPLYTDSIDNINGYFLRDDLLAALVEDKDSDKLGSLRRELTAVKEDFPIPDLFTHFTEQRTHIAMVMDEFGGTGGIVTMEDVIETLLGMEIVDEVDGDADMQALARQQWERRAERLGLLESSNPDPTAAAGKKQ